MPFAPFPEWKWQVPEFLNIGVACTDAHLATAAQERPAMIVEDDAHGTSQVTYDGWPLYYFQGDEAAGDANGQGLNDVWWVVAPDGTHVGASGS